MNNRLRKNQKGSILVVVLMVLLVLSFIGVASLTTSRTEVEMATNLSIAQDVFYAADGGLFMGIGVLNDVVDNLLVPGAWSSIVQQNDTTNDIVTELTILGAPEGDDPDVITVIGNSNVTLDIDMSARNQLQGSSIEFAGGYEGLGMSASQGGYATFYTIMSTATKNITNSSRSELQAGYRKTTGVGG